MGEKVAAHLQQGASIIKSRSSSFSVLWTCRCCLAPWCTAAAHSRLTSNCFWQIIHNKLLELILCNWSARSSNQILIMESWVQDVLLLFHTNCTYWGEQKFSPCSHFHSRTTRPSPSLVAAPDPGVDRAARDKAKELILDRTTRNLPQNHA